MGNDIAVPVLRIQKVGKWRKPGDINAFENEVQSGDRLEFQRRWFSCYSHWGIYVGKYEGMEHAVVHCSVTEGGWTFFKEKTSGSASSASQKPKILADTIGNILNGSGWVRFNNSKDKNIQPLFPGDISEKAKKMHRDETPIDYNLIKRNCEHFVNLCRYDKAFSEQVNKAEWNMMGCFFLGCIVCLAASLVASYAVLVSDA
ncbi:phospholipase A and acyltransferase 1-like [Patiria miniata]|uniref:LRAT domain-containing protein n=1 Tax=Patiria miniata TaxID=46514 RepID=A0A914A5Y8_PATMI|nr:phospholipase A and acyltransferase 1-like [Patiria miniata]